MCFSAARALALVLGSYGLQWYTLNVLYEGFLFQVHLQLLHCFLVFQYYKLKYFIIYHSFHRILMFIAFVPFERIIKVKYNYHKNLLESFDASF